MQQIFFARTVSQDGARWLTQGHATSSGPKHLGHAPLRVSPSASTRCAHPQDKRRRASLVEGPPAVDNYGAKPCSAEDTAVRQ